MKGLRITGKMGMISRTLHEQVKNYGRKTKAVDWARVIEDQGLARQVFIEDMKKAEKGIASCQ